MDSARIADQIAKMSSDELSQMSVLSRTHALLRRLSEELTSRNIPHTYVGWKSALTNSEEFRKFHAFLKLLVNPYDDFSFLLIRELIALNPRDYAEIRVKAAQEGKSHFQAWMDRRDDNDIWESFFTSAREWNLSGVVNNLRFMEPLIGSLFTSSHQFAMDWSVKNPKGTVKTYLDWLATFDTQDELTDEQEELTLCTIHAAKGLEWPVVIVAACNDGIIPSKQAIAAGELEEERRLMYVAMTRAMDQLILTVRPEKTERDGKVYENPISRFISETLG